MTLPAAERDHTVDIVKGFAIFIVVAVHASAGLSGLSFIVFLGDCVIPAFFFLSGFYFNPRHLTDVPGYVKHKFKSLWWPSFQVLLLFLLLHNLWEPLHIVAEPITMHQFWHNLLINLRLGSTEELTGTMWFCQGLMGSLMIFIAVMWVFRKSHPLVLACAMVVMFLSAMVALKHGYHLPLVMLECMVQCFILYTGYLFRRFIDTYPDKIGAITSRPWLALLLAALLFYISAQISSNGMHFNMQFDVLPDNNIMATMIIPAIASIGLWLVADQIGKSEPLEYLGRHSFAILAFHLLAFCLIDFVVCALYDEPWALISSHPRIARDGIGWYIAYLATGIGLPLLLSAFYRRCLAVAGNWKQLRS